MDENNDGYLQRNEVFLAIAKMKKQNVTFHDNHVSDPARFVDGLMSEVDMDGDGQIDHDEFMEMMSKGLFSGSNNGGGDGFSNAAHNKLHKISQFARNVFLSHQQRIESNTIGDDMWLIHPLSKFHFSWDVLVSLLILAMLITLPLSLGWEHLNDDFFILTLVFDMVFVADMCKTFFTGYIDVNDAIVMDAKAVRMNYLSGYFLPDFLGSFPYDLTFKIVSDAKKLEVCQAIICHLLFVTVVSQSVPLLAFCCCFHRQV